MLGLAALAVTTSASAAGIGTPRAELPAELDRSADAVVAEFAAAETTARSTPDVPALEVGATPLGARRPVELDVWRATNTGRLPGTAAYAYTFASSALEEAEPNCGLRWSLLAAVGRIESNHGRVGEARLDDQGVVAPAVRGASLDGSRGTSAVRDTDAGDLDGNRRFDRAVGPMQLLPSTWGVVGVDADGDGKRNPDDIDDAALGAAVLLCGAPGRLTTEAGLAEALERYNAAPGYAAAVAALERKYRSTGVPVATLGGSAAALAPSTPSASLEALIAGDADDADDLELLTLRTGGRDGGSQDGGDRNDSTGDGKGDGDSKGDSKGDGKGGDHPTNTPNEPNEPNEPKPTDPPSEPTEPPAPVCSDTPVGAAPPSQHSGTVTAVSGALTCDGSGWYVAGGSVAVGDAAWLSTLALADFDADGSVESNLEELRGLVGTTVTAGVDDAGTVWTLQSGPYLPAPATPSPSPSPSRTPNPSPSGGASPSASGSATPSPSATSTD